MDGIYTERCMISTANIEGGEIKSRGPNIDRRNFLLSIAVTLLGAGCTDQNELSDDTQMRTEGKVTADDLQAQVIIDGATGDAEGAVKLLNHSPSFEDGELIIEGVVRNVSDDDVTIPDRPILIDARVSAEGYNYDSGVTSIFLSPGEKSSFKTNIDIVSGDRPEAYQLHLEVQFE